MRTSSIAFVGALALIATEAHAANWQLLMSGAKTLVYIDTDTIVRDGSIATVWVRTKYRKPAKISEALDQTQYNCATRQRRPLYVVNYSPDGKNDGGPAIGDWAPVVPDSVGEATWELVCKAAISEMP